MELCEMMHNLFSDFDEVRNGRRSGSVNNKSV